jgi:hypothetical protein
MSGTTWWMQIAYVAWVACGYAVLFLFGAAVIRLLRWLDGRRKRIRRDDEG